MRRTAGNVLALVIVGLACNLASAARAAKVFLVEQGRPRAEIVIAEQPPRTVKLAAQELADYVKRLSGATLPITTRPSGGGAQVYVGRSAFTDRLKLSDAGLKHGAFRIVTGDDWLALLGHDADFMPKEPFLRSHPDLPRLLADWDRLTGEKWGFPYTQIYKRYSKQLDVWELDERGSLNAVYEFLRMQGVRWYMPGALGEIVPEQRTIEIGETDRTVHPDFPLRFFEQYATRFALANRDEVLWQLRLGLNEAPDLIGLGDMAHGINNVHSRPEVKQAHPEYFALWAGKRATEHHGAGAQCLSSPGLFAQNVKYVRKMFDIFDVPMVSVMPQDGYVSICQCDLCKGKDTPERGFAGQISDYVWDYVNRVALEVGQTHPHKKIICYAYGAYALPPAKIARLSPNIVVGIAQSRSQSGVAEEWQRIEQLRKDWRAKLPADHRFMQYEYYLHGRPTSQHEGMPVFFPYAIAQDLQALKGISIGDYVEVYRERDEMTMLGVNHLNLYVTARLWWNANESLNDILPDYYAEFYGPAKREMKAFVEFSISHWQNLKNSVADVDRALELLAAARTAAGDSIYGKRIALVADFVRPLKQLRTRLATAREGVPQARVINRSRADLTLDGRLDDPFWEGLYAYPLRDLQTGKAPTANRTTFKLARDDNRVYFGIRCDDDDMPHLNVTATKNEDSNVWQGDNVELLLETGVHSYYQIAISPSGAFLDADRKERINTLWASGAQIAAYRGDGFWSVEVCLPVAGDLQADVDPLHGVAGRVPSRTYPWYFNVCRQRVRDGKRELSAFSAKKGAKNFHDHLSFGELITPR